MFFRKSEGDPAREVGSSGAGDGEFMSKDVGPARSAGWARCRAILERLSVLSELERLGTTQMSPGSDKITKTRGDIGSKLQHSHLTCSYPHLPRNITLAIPPASQAAAHRYAHLTKFSTPAMSLAAVRPSSSTRLSPHSSNDHSLRSTRQHPDDSSPSDSFGNLDPQLHPGTLNGVTQEPDLSPQAENRLNDFAQHVLDGHHDALLAFTAGEDGSLFGSNHDHQPFEGLLASQRQDERVEGDDAQDEEYKLEGVEDEKNHDLAGETIPGRTRGGGRKRRREGEEGENGGTTAVLKVKKDSHKEVERRRRENINDGIGEIARLIPGGLEKMGKGTLLRRAAEFMAELAEKVARSDADIAKREVEKSELQNELVHVQNRLADEHARSIRYETSWREAEDRAAGSQFELERVRGELEAPRK